MSLIQLKRPFISHPALYPTSDPVFTPVFAPVILANNKFFQEFMQTFIERYQSPLAPTASSKAEETRDHTD